MTATKGQKRPYPNVVPTPAGHWEARRPSNGRSQHLGTFDTPEAAYRVVLLAQAENLEHKAAGYRDAAERLPAGNRKTKNPKGKTDV